jgi:hypothetical protein
MTKFQNLVSQASLLIPLVLGVSGFSTAANAAAIYPYSDLVAADLAPLLATINIYTDLTAWKGATGSPIATENFADTTLLPGLTIKPGLFGAISGGVYQDQTSAGSTSPIFSFAAGTTAFAADWDLTPNDVGTGLALAAHLAGSPAGNFVPAGSFRFDTGFFGIVSNASFDQIRIDPANLGFCCRETFNLDNLRFPTLADNVPLPVPLSPALPLFASGLVALGWLGKRRKRSTAAS